MKRSSQQPRLPLRRLIVALALGVLASAGCSSGDGDSPRTSEGKKAPSELPDTPLYHPEAAEMQVQAPNRFKARFTTSRGPVVFEFHREWAPHGVDRAYNLIRHGFYDGLRFYRVLEDRMAQFGIHGDPQLSAVWKQAYIPDDPARESNTRGRLAFARTPSANSRATTLFVSLTDNSYLDPTGFVPVAEAVEGIEVLDQVYAGYGEIRPHGSGPSQSRLMEEGNAYLEKEYPELDIIEKAEVIEPVP